MDFYIVLGVGHGASESEIRRAYRRLARQFHPGVNPGDRAAAARFQQIVDAYETLVDPARRSRYDSGGDIEARTPPATGFDGFDFSSRGVDHSASFGDLFADVLLERGAAQKPPERGADLHHELELSFDESMRGAQRSVSVTRRETCQVCAGKGASRQSSGECLECHATGTIRSARGHMVFSRRCQSCGGTGRRAPRACEGCAGAGFQTRVESVPVSVPAGIADGDHLQVHGKGNAGLRGGAPGDLFVRVQVATDPQFRRDGDDLHTVVPIAVHEAALGAQVEISTPDGLARLRVPPGTQSGRRFRVRGGGVPSARDGVRGDLVVEVRIVLPPALDERSKDLLREFGRLNGDSVRQRTRG